jgi:hypothetical protein
MRTSPRGPGGSDYAGSGLGGRGLHDLVGEDVPMSVSMAGGEHRLDEAGHAWATEEAAAGPGTFGSAGSGSAGLGDALRELSMLLFEERELLATLVFKLDEAHLVLVGAGHRWLTRATAEVGEVVQRLGEMDARRVELVGRIASAMGLSGEAMLGELAEAAGEPWREGLLAHRHALIGAVQQVQRAAARNREALSVHLAAVNEAIDVLGNEILDAPGTYETPYGPPVTTASSPMKRGRGPRVVDARL